MSPANSPQHSPCGSSPSQPGMSPVKSPVSALPPLNGTLNVAKRRKVDALSPNDHRRVYSASGGKETPNTNTSTLTSPMTSLVTPSKRSVSTPARLGTPRGGKRTPSLADRPIPVLMPQDEEDEVSRSRRSSYANLYVTESVTEGDKTDVAEGKEKGKDEKETKHVEQKEDKKDTKDTKEKDTSASTASNNGSIPEAGELRSDPPSDPSDKSFSESAPIGDDALKATLLPPPKSLEPPASPRKR